MSVNIGGNKKPGLVFSIDQKNPRSWRGRPTTNYLVTTQFGINSCMGRSDKRPFNWTSHSARDRILQGTGFTFTPGAAINIPEKPAGTEDADIWYVRDSNPDNFSRFSPFNGLDLDELPAYDTTYVVSSYVYIPPNITLGTSNFIVIVQNNTGTDWHTASSGSTAVYNSQYNYWSHNIETGTEVIADTNNRGVWQRIHQAFIPESAIRDQESASGIIIDKLGGYMRPNLVGQAQENYYFVTASQLELGTVPSPFVYGERTNTQAILDISGQNHTVTANSLQYPDDGTWSFSNATNDEITVTDNSILRLSEAITVTGWIRPDASQNNLYPRVLDKSHYLIHLGQTFPASLVCNINTSGGLRQTAIGGVINSGVWQHIAVSYDGQIGKVYVNGELRNTNDFGSVLNINTSNTPLVIGGNTNTDRQYNGDIAAINIYNTALTDNQILDHFNATRNQYGI